jgi:murein DD-endopeptidase MepM/ murein hydrolase activator NlpD
LNLGVSIKALKTSMPVFKAFGLTSDRKKLLYTPLKNGFPSGELFLENMKTGENIKVTSKLVLSASISPVDDDLIAYTFAGGENFGLAVSDLGSGRSEILAAENVFAENIEWDSFGEGINYFETSVPEPTLKQDGIVFSESSQSGSLNLRNKHISINSLLPSNDYLLTNIPAGFPVLEKPGNSSSTEEQTQNEYAFRARTIDGNYEVFGENFLGVSSLFAREKLSRELIKLGDGQLVKVLPTGIVFKEFSANSSKLKFVDWKGNTTSIGIMTVNYNLPVSSSVMTQGGTGYNPPGNCNITAHTGGLEYAYDFQSPTVSEHVMASAGGLVVFNTSSVTCNTIDTTSCPDYNANGCPGSYLGNIVIIQHADGSYSKYAHMETNSPQVAVGTTVDQGLYIGRQGHTGSTSGTFNGCGDHVHFQLQSSPDIFGQSIAVDFADVAVEPLSCGTTYTSASTEISHSISPSSQSFGIGGGSGTVNVTSTGGTWAAFSNDNWITVTSAGSGMGNGFVNYSVADNSAGGQRTGTMNIGGHIFTVTQSGGGVTNQGPTVNAGSDQTITLPSSATLNGTAADDGLPNPPATLTTTWSKVSGPGTVTFANANAMTTTASFSIAGIYVLRITANDNSLSTSDDLTVIVNTNNGGGILIGNQTQPPANINLTTEGTTDWAHWGQNSPSSFDHKNGVAQQISNFTQIGSITPLRYTNNSNSFTWTDGTPTSSISGSTTGIYTYGIGNGFQLTFPADTMQRTLKLYVGLWAAGGKLEATLSDGGASPFISTSLISSGVLNGVYTINYRAISSGQTLTINWTIDSNSNALGNVTLQAATLAVLAPPTNQPPTVNAGNDQTITLPVSATLTGTATDDGLPNPPATLTTTWSKLSGPGTVIFANANSLNTTASFGSSGTYVLRLSANDSALTSFDEVTVTANNNSGTGSLSGSRGNTPANVNLTTEGTSDWAHWGLSSPASFNHKSVVTQQISNFTPLGAGTIQRYTNNPNLYTWTGGTPTASTTNTASGVYVIGANNGYQITLPADTTQRTLKLYVGLWAAGGKFEASLSDGSAPTFTDTSLISSNSTVNGVYSLSYRAGASGQILTVKWTVNTTFNQWSNVTLQAATLVGGAVPPSNQVPTANAGIDQTITLPSAATLNGSATDDGLPNPPATLTTTWSKVSGPGTVAFGNANSLNTTASFSTNGTYALRLTASDSALSTTDDVVITVNSAGSSTGTLSVSRGTPPASINLTTVGTIDWAHWGLSSPSSFNHKSGVTQQISNFTPLGNGTIQRYTNNPNLYTWTGGAPVASATNTASGVYVIGQNNGFQITLPADTTQRTLKLYVGLWAAGGKLEASLSDSSAPTFIDTSVSSSNSTVNAVYFLDYKAASAGQTLTIKWTVDTIFSQWSNVTLQGAAL